MGKGVELGEGVEAARGDGELSQLGTVGGWEEVRLIGWNRVASYGRRCGGDEAEGDVAHLSGLEHEDGIGLGVGGFRLEDIHAGFETQAQEGAIGSDLEAVDLDAIFGGEAELNGACSGLGLQDAATQGGVRGALRVGCKGMRQGCEAWQPQRRTDSLEVNSVPQLQPSLRGNGPELHCSARGLLTTGLLTAGLLRTWRSVWRAGHNQQER